MNFNKDYPIAILDTNIVMDFPNILDILKGCNIVIPYTLIEELDNHKKENKGARDFVNNFLALSEKSNLSKDGYKLENDCMLYLDMDKNNSYHKDINLDSKKQDIKFIAEAKNLKEKYNDMAVVLLSSDKIMKITASAFDVEANTISEFIFKYLKGYDKINSINKIYNLFNSYVKVKKSIGTFDLIDAIDGYKYNEGEREMHMNELKKILDIMSYYLYLNKDIKELNRLLYLSQGKDFCNIIANMIFRILDDNKDIEGLKNLSLKISLNELRRLIRYKISELENNK